MTKKKQASFDFEKALEELEELVSSMEDGKLSLEDSLQAFEKGIKLTRECQTALKKAEQKIKYHQNLLGLRLRSIYKEGSVFPLKIIFSSLLLVLMNLGNLFLFHN